MYSCVLTQESRAYLVGNDNKLAKQAMYSHDKLSQMKRHSYLGNFTPTEEQLLLSTVDAWTSYADNINKRPKSSPYVAWKCFACGEKIKVHYKHARCRDLYCDKCRPIIVKKNGILLRYMLMFKNHVRALILKHTNIERVLR